MTHVNHGARLIYDAAFQLDSTDYWFEYPYVLVQWMPYAKYGLQKQLNEDEFPQFVRMMSGLDMVKLVDKTVSSGGARLLNDVEMGQAELDAANRRFRWTWHLDLQGIGPIRALAVGYFGRQSIVRLVFYSRSTEWDHHSDAAPRCYRRTATVGRPGAAPPGPSRHPQRLCSLGSSERRLQWQTIAGSSWRSLGGCGS